MPYRNEVATASIFFYFKVGSKNEIPEFNGISHFIEHMCFKGSKKYPSYTDISKTFDANGISFNAFTSKTITAYHYKFLSTKHNMDIICKITSDMIMNPLMRDSDIKTERNVIIQEYNDDLDDIDEYINEKLESCLFEGHPLSYSVIGNLKTINSINRKELLDFHKKFYRADNLVIGFSGRMRDEYFNIIETYFGGKGAFKSIDEAHQVQGALTIIPFNDKNPITKIDCFSKDLTQDYVHINFKTKGIFDPLRMQYKLLMNILGVNMSSRLFIEIREKLGLAYTIKCDMSNYEETGYFNIYTQNEIKDTIKCIDAIMKQIVIIKEKLVDDVELNANKTNYCDYHQTNFDDIEYENEYYANQILINNPIETLQMRIKSIQAITASELLIAANELFDFNKIHIITFGKVKQPDIQSIIKKYTNLQIHT